MNAAPTNKRLYSVNGMVVGAVLGSLAAAIYMAAYNYVALGQPTLAKRIVQIGIILYGAILLLAMTLPESQWVMLPLALLQTGMAWFLASRLQGLAIDHHRQAGGQVQGWVQVVLVSLATGAALLFLVFIVALSLSLIGQMPTL